MTDTQTEVIPVSIEDPGGELDDGSSSPEDVKHYVDQRFDQDVTAAMIEGTEVVALCGYRWVPFRAPDKLPLCKPCVEELRRILS